jgi:hypothetical protein
MSEPYEIIMAPYEVWLAVVGTAFPDVDESPAAAWKKLGTSGDDNMDEAGVTVTHDQTIVQRRTVGSTGPVKVTRTEEGLSIGLTLLDLSVEQYAKALNGVTVTDTAAGVGTPGVRTITLRQGRDVTLYALLCRGVSPYGDSFVAQYQVPKCFQSDNPAPVFNKGDAAALAERFGKLVSQDAAAT